MVNLNSDQLESNVSLIRELAKRFKGRVSKCNLHDYQVARAPFDWYEALQSSTPRPDTFVRKLHCKIDDNRTLIRINDEYVVIEISKNVKDSIVCSFGEKNVFFLEEHFGTAIKAPAALSSIFQCDIFLLNNNASEDTPLLLKDAYTQEYIRALSLDHGESLHILQGQIALYLKRNEIKVVLEAITIFSKFVCSLPEGKDEAIDFENLPKEFHALIPLIKRWGIADDDERNEVLSKASSSTINRLVQKVTPYFDAINHYLNSFTDVPLPEHAVALRSLAECVSEALSGTKGTTKGCNS